MDEKKQTAEELLAEKKASLYTEVYNKAKEVDGIENISYQKGMKDYEFFFTVNDCNCQWVLRRKTINQVKINCKIKKDGMTEADAKREGGVTKAKYQGILFHYSKIENSLTYVYNSTFTMDTTIEELMEKLITFVEAMKDATLRHLSIESAKETDNEPLSKEDDDKPNEKGNEPEKKPAKVASADGAAKPSEEEKKPARAAGNRPPKSKNSGVRKSNQKNERSSQSEKKDGTKQVRVREPEPNNKAKAEKSLLPEEMPDELPSVTDTSDIDDVMDEINDLFGNVDEVSGEGDEEAEEKVNTFKDEIDDFFGDIAVALKGDNDMPENKEDTNPRGVKNIYVEGLEDGNWYDITPSQIAEAFIRLANDNGMDEDDALMCAAKKLAKEKGNDAFKRLHDEWGIDSPKSGVDAQFRSAMLTKQKFLEKKEASLKQRETDLDEKLLELRSNESSIKQAQKEQRNEQIRLEKAKQEMYAERKELKKLSEAVEEERRLLMQETKAHDEKEKEIKEREIEIVKAKKEYEDKLAALRRYEEETQRKVEQTNKKLFDIDKRESDLQMREELLKTQNDNLKYAMEELAEKERTLAEKSGDTLSPDALDELAKEHEKQEQMAIQLSEKAMECEKQQKQIEQYLNTINAAKNKMMEFNERYKALQEELVKERGLLKQAQEEAQEAKETVTQSSAGSEKSSEEVTEELDSLRAEKEELNNELESLRESEAGLKEELESHKNDVAKLNKELTKLKKQLEGVSDNKQDEQLDQLNKQLEETKEQLSKAEANNVEIHNKLVEMQQKAEPNYTVLSVKEELTNMGIPCEVVPSEGPIVLKVERDGCVIYINEEEKNIIAEKPVKSAGKYKTAVEQLNAEDKSGLYQIGNKKIRVKKFLTNASQDVLFVAEKLRNFN